MRKLLWLGKGYRIPVFVFLSSLAGNILVLAILGDDAYWHENRWTLGVCLLVAAFLSRKFDPWGKAGVGEIHDSETHEAVESVDDIHLFCLLPTSLWGPILFVVGIVTIVYDLVT